MITLNIIYMPQTAVYLSYFALTLLRWSTHCQLRLIANGCSKAEIAHLTTLCTQHQRMSLMVLPNPLAHSTVLNQLQHDNTDPIFAIIDSDIYAVGPFMPVQPMTTLTCSLPPALFWDEADEAFQQHRHRFGCTYFALYDNETLTQLRQQQGIGFEKQEWHTLTQSQQATLTAIHYQKRFYDTGKLLNALLSANGHLLTFADATHLRHLGGISRAQKQTLSYSRLLYRFYKHRIWPSRRALHQRAQRKQRKLQSNRYFGQLLDAMYNEYPTPPLPRMGSPFIEEKMRAATDEIIAIYRT